MRVTVSSCAGSAAIVAVAAMALVPATTSAWPDYLMAWEAKYPTSTLPQRMATLTGSQCNVCHHPPNTWNVGTCYRLDIRHHTWVLGLTIEEALDIVHDMDSTGDGVPNGIQILMQRADDPSHIGYHPGLSGPTGRDPCAADPHAPVTNQNETPMLGCYADCDDNEVLNIDDFLCFINAFAEAQSLPYAQQVTHYANCDGSTAEPVLTIDDFLCYINAFAAGCP